MTLSKETELGTITVSNVLFAQIIGESFKIETCADRVWPATRKGRQIGNDAKFSYQEFASHIDVTSAVEEGAENRSEKNSAINIEFSIIVKFGTSIRKVTDAIADYVADTLYEKQGKRPDRIKIRISGVKSKQIAKRNLEVVKNYGIK